MSTTRKATSAAAKAAASGAAKAAKRRRPMTPEGQENLLIGLAFDLAEKMLREGTAPAQVITHFLKLATVREKLEQLRLENENLLLAAKVDQMASAKRIEELYEKALQAMQAYSGREVDGPI